MDCRTVILPMGQGAMNLIEIYDDYHRLVHLTLIDCGGDDGALASKVARCESLDYAAGKMEERFRSSQNACYLDYLLLTHKDQDHWNMLIDLLEEVIGTPLSIHLKNIGFCQETEESGEIHTYFVNKTMDKCSYLTYFKDDCEIHASVSFYFIGYTLEFEYFYNGRKLSFSRSFQSICFTVSDEDMDENCISISSVLGQFHVCLGGEKSGTIIQDLSGNPQSMDELKALFERIMNEYLQNYIEIPEEFRDRIWRILDNLNISRDDIAARALQKPETSFSFIRSVFIGGRSLPEGIEFSRMTRAIREISGEINYGLQAGHVIPLYSHISLYVIQRMWACGLSSICEAESKTRKSIQNNATSIVSVLVSSKEFACQKVVFSGDATVHTFYQMYCDLHSEDLEYYYENAVWTAPHHGSSVTCRGRFSEQGDEVFPSLLKEVFPSGMVISAGCENRHGHPGCYFTEIMLACLGGRNVGSHFLHHNINDSCKRMGAEWDWSVVSCPLYSTYTIPDISTTAKYTAYVIPFLGDGIQTIPVDKLYQGARDSALCIEAKERPETFLFSGTEAPSEELFFQR